MPIYVRDPWREQYFDGVACPPEVRVPIDDTDAWAWFPEHRWIYDRLAVALSQGMKAGPHGADPGEFPVFSKPIVNLKGMGIGSRAIASRAVYDASYEPGHMWMPKLTGPHVSTDCAVLDGAIVWSRHAQGKPAPGGMFRWWKVWGRRDDDLMAYLSDWSARHLKGYAGMVNFETIGGRIIEAHLRFADQWTDLYGPGWVQAMVRLYAEGVWRFDDDQPREGFSIPLFTSDQGKVRPPGARLIAEVTAMPAVSSVQITFHPDKPLGDQASPPGGKRLALVNAWRLKEGRAALARLAQGFPHQSLI
ncbi:MAG: hypothetical protein ACOVVK_15510 [Elsteraceae bacterium]